MRFSLCFHCTESGVAENFKIAGSKCCEETNFEAAFLRAAFKHDRGVNWGIRL